MMRSLLQLLVGKAVNSITLVPEAAGMRFTDESTLNIYNAFSVAGTSTDDAGILIGHLIVRVTEEPDTITIVFDNQVAIAIDRRDAAYINGPEVLQLCIPSLPIIIVN